MLAHINRDRSAHHHGKLPAANGNQPNIYRSRRGLGGKAFTFELPVCLSCNGLGGALAGGASINPVLSADGQLIAFESAAHNLASVDPCPAASDQVVLMNALAQSVTSQIVGGPSSPFRCSSGGSRNPSMDYSGAMIAFESDLPLTNADTNAQTDAFVVNPRTGSTIRVSETPSGTQASTPSLAPVISGDGSTVAFVSAAQNLDPVVPDTGPAPICTSPCCWADSGSAA